MIIAILIPFVVKSGDFAIDGKTILLLILFGFIFQVFASFIHVTGIKIVKSQSAAVLAYAEPLAATIYGTLFFSEIPRKPNASPLKVVARSRINEPPCLFPDP